MVLNTVTVGAAVTPTVVKTYITHYLDRKPRRHRPTAHIPYDEGLNLIRQFLSYASHHTVEEIQAFTSQWVPTPRWIKVDEVTIPETSIAGAADAIVSQLGHHGIDKVGGSEWWRWRRDESILKAEWIEMRADYNRRKKAGDKGNRVMLYVHGGAYFFGSVDEHRYQMQRHARKLKARVFARLLVILRDQEIPLPAGAMLISPWVDLTHSFPSVAIESPFDYIPAHGFLQRPSAAWPPPNADDMKQIAVHAVEAVVEKAMPRTSTQQARHNASEVAVQGFSVDSNSRGLDHEGNVDSLAGTDREATKPGNTIPGPGHNLSLMIDGKLIEIKDQIQMYTTNQLISHPLVSPALQPSLGGLPPLLIQTGGGEVLRDEQIYLAHKAANPARYPPSEAYLNEYPEAKETVAKWKPTDVQLQVWDDLCHVAPTLSFTRPAKYMYRSIAQFGAWALARAQKTEIEIMDDDNVSIISSGSRYDSDTTAENTEIKQEEKESTSNNGTSKSRTASTAGLGEQIGRAGDPLPPFRNHMIRQRIDRHGNIYPLEPPSRLPALQMSPSEIGVIKPGPVLKWMAAKQIWDTKFAREKRRVQKTRIKEMSQGYQDFNDDDVPPPSALAGRRSLTMPKEQQKKRSWGMSLWSLWGSTHDKKTLDNEERADALPATTAVTPLDGANARPVNAPALLRPPMTTAQSGSRSRSRRRAVTDAGQADNQDIDADTSAAEILAKRGEHNIVAENLVTGTRDPALLAPAFISLTRSPGAGTTPSESPGLEGGGTKAEVTLREGATRPYVGGVAFPFSLGRGRGGLDGEGASVRTLTSQEGVLGRVGGEVVGGGEGEGGGKKVDGDSVGDVTGGVEVGIGEEPERRPAVERFVTAREAL